MLVEAGTYSNKKTIAVDLLLRKLLSRASGNVRIVGNRVKRPESIRLRLSDGMTSLLQSRAIDARQAAKHVTRASTAYFLRKSIVVVLNKVCIVFVLEGKVRRGSERVVKEERAEGTADCESLVHD